MGSGILLRRNSRTVNWKPAILRLWKQRDVKLLLVVALLSVLVMAWKLQPSPENTQVALEYLGQRVVEGGETEVLFRLTNDGDLPVSYLTYYDRGPMVDFFSANGVMQKSGRLAGTPAYAILRPGEAMDFSLTPALIYGPWYAEITYWQGDRSSSVSDFIQKAKSLVVSGKLEPLPEQAKTVLTNGDVIQPSIASLLKAAEKILEEQRAMAAQKKVMP